MTIKTDRMGFYDGQTTYSMTVREVTEKNWKISQTTVQQQAEQAANSRKSFKTMRKFFANY